MNPYNRDPADIIEEADTASVRRAFGCTACRHRAGELLGRVLCTRGHQAGQRGYCRRWDLDEQWHGKRRR